jgi:hypothetical protein
MLSSTAAGANTNIQLLNKYHSILREYMCCYGLDRAAHATAAMKEYTTVCSCVTQVHLLEV